MTTNRITLDAARDVSIVAGAVAVAALVWDSLEWRITGKNERTQLKDAEKRANPHDLAAPHGWLHRVGGGFGPHDAVRPATRQEARISQLSAETDGGDGVFGRSYDGGEPVLPDAPQFGHPGTSYYVVRDYAAAA